MPLQILLHEDQKHCCVWCTCVRKGREISERSRKKWSTLSFSLVFCFPASKGSSNSKPRWNPKIDGIFLPSKSHSRTTTNPTHKPHYKTLTIHLRLLFSTVSLLLHRGTMQNDITHRPKIFTTLPPPPRYQETTPTTTMTIGTTDDRPLCSTAQHLLKELPASRVAQE